MYSVADGLSEQKMQIQGRIPRPKAEKLINSFKSVIMLHKHYSPHVRKGDAYKYEHPLTANGEVPVLANDDKRYTLSTVVPVTVEFLNFEHFMKVMDDFAEKKHVQIFVGDHRLPQQNLSRLTFQRFS